MTRDVIFSLALHGVIIVATVVSSPFDVSKRSPYGEVIRVSLMSLPSPPAKQAPEPVTIPQIRAETPSEIPLQAPTTAKEAKVTPKPKVKKERTTGTTDESAASDKKQIESPATGTGSPFYGATIDNATFDYPYWFTQAFNKIAGNWRNPVLYEGTLVCAVYFQVIRSGKMIEIRVETSSGVPAFDQACLTAIERSTPFPPLPGEFRDEIIGITVPFKNR
ncbi:MAG TPA: TonB family protein [Candidatus Deferrimicrobium sp.]|nr:TonB family protein [Candidatus Deferrimicrobium sp.]